MKWGTKYPADYVNRLYSMVSRNLSGDFRFICLTDDAAGIRREIEIKPLPEVPVPGTAERCWRKLGILKKDLFDIEGDVLFLDVDIVIVKPIDCFFEQSGYFLIIKEWKADTVHGLGNSSVFRFKAGAFNFVYEEFLGKSQEISKNFRHEQAFLTARVNERGLIGYWPQGWCASFKRNCMRGFPSSIFFEARLPEDAKIIIFHGHPTPEEAIEGRINGLKRFVRFLRPTAWINKYWR